MLGEESSSGGVGPNPVILRHWDLNAMRNGFRKRNGGFGNQKGFDVSRDIRLILYNFRLIFDQTAWALDSG